MYSQGHTAPGAFVPTTTTTTTTTTTHYPVPPPMERNPAISKLPKAYVEQEMLRLIALAHGFENISGSSSSSCSTCSSESDSCWPVASGSRTHGDFPEWVYQLALGTSEESVSEYDEDNREADSGECLFETPCSVPMDLGFHKHLYNSGEVQETVLVAEKDWGYSTSSMADDECEEVDDGVWGVGGAPVPPMLMKRQLASSGRCL